MTKYRFEHLNNGFEIENPTIIINPIVANVNPIQMTIDVDIIMTTSNAKFGVRLENVSVQNLTYTSETLSQRVYEHLSQFEIQ